MGQWIEVGIPECWRDHMGEGCGEDCKWEKTRFRSVFSRELATVTELKFAQIVGLRQHAEN